MKVGWFSRWIQTKAALAVFSCMVISAPAADRSYTVTATVGMVADVVREVAGPHAEVTALIGEGIDPHLYKPTRGDVTTLLRSDIVFYSGLKLEGKMGDVLEKIAARRPVHAVTEEIDASYLLHPDGSEGHADPHVWMDVGAWVHTVDIVERALTDFDPANREDYARRAAAFRERLRELDEYARRVTATIPEKQRILITAHDAFNYFGRAYGLRVLGIQGLSTESEAGLDDINQLVDLIVENDVRSVFVETSVADKNVKALIEGAAARGGSVSVGGTLFSDAMGEYGTYEGTYIGMLDHNATVITRSLGGEAPPRGMQGRLKTPEGDAR